MYKKKNIKVIKGYNANSSYYIIGKREDLWVLDYEQIIWWNRKVLTEIGKVGRQRGTIYIIGMKGWKEETKCYGKYNIKIMKGGISIKEGQHSAIKEWSKYRKNKRIIEGSLLNRGKKERKPEMLIIIGQEDNIGIVKQGVKWNIPIVGVMYEKNVGGITYKLFGSNNWREGDILKVIVKVVKREIENESQ